MRTRALMLSLTLAAVPALAQSHLNVAPGKFVQVTFTHKAGDPTNVFSNMVQISNDGTFGAVFTIPAGQALVITDVSMQSYAPFGYTGSLDGFVALRWYVNNQQTFTTVYAESFKAGGASEQVGLSRSFTAGRIFAASTNHSPMFSITTPWDPAFANLQVVTTGYLINYP